MSAVISRTREPIQKGDFAHAGDLGDIIYSLPCVRDHGGAETYWLHTIPGKTSHTMTPERAAAIIPLLEFQDYIKAAKYSPNEFTGSNIDGFRDWSHSAKAIVDWHRRTLGQPVTDGEEIRPWLKRPKPNKVARVVVHRSPRYRPTGSRSTFHWRELLTIFQNDVVFVGTKAERGELASDYGVAVPFHETKDFLELAEVIAGAELFIGNQSAPLAVASGLGGRTVAQGCRSSDNCDMHRANSIVLYEGEELTFSKFGALFRRPDPGK